MIVPGSAVTDPDSCLRRRRTTRMAGNFQSLRALLQTEALGTRGVSLPSAEILADVAERHSGVRLLHRPWHPGVLYSRAFYRQGDVHCTDVALELQSRHLRGLGLVQEPRIMCAKLGCTASGEAREVDHAGILQYDQWISGEYVPRGNVPGLWDLRPSGCFPLKECKAIQQRVPANNFLLQLSAKAAGVGSANRSRKLRCFVPA